MAEYATDAMPEYRGCTHVIKVTGDYNRAETVDEWISDPDRPGHWHWGKNTTRDVWWLHVSDPDVAFEAKMRWA